MLEYTKRIQFDVTLFIVDDGVFFFSVFLLQIEKR